MDRTFYIQLAHDSLQGKVLEKALCRKILTCPEIELLPLLDAAFEVRQKYHGRDVAVHVINNIQNGLCPEDCHYCAQARTADSSIEKYPVKGEAEILAEAKRAYESGAFRYCMVSSGRGPSEKRVEQLVSLIKTIKSQYPIQICISAGLLDENGVRKLKEAGLDRLNHNLNTSEQFYPQVCTTHTYQDRLNTLKAAQKAGLPICSGVIAGMGETHEDIVDVGLKLRELNSPSIPVNFLIPIEGTAFSQSYNLNPQYCLRILCLYRFLNPATELRVAAGREGHLRSLEVMALYPANSLFLDGYLNTKGSSTLKTLRMIKDAGFTIKSDKTVEELLRKLEVEQTPYAVDDQKNIMKELNDLRPVLNKN